jgi:hypothetical protein
MVLHVPRRTAAQAPVPSKLSCPACVPTASATVTAIRLGPPPYDAGEHATAVAVVHEVLLHVTDSSSDADGLGSFLAKLSPLMDTSTPPVCAAFAGLMLVKAGAAQSSSRSWCCTSHGARPRKRPYRRS